jgi:hypothetical protein
MNPPRDPAAPARNVPISQALKDSEPLHGLLKRVAESRSRLESIQSLLPVGLRSSVRAGPLDDSTWMLLVDNAAAAAKLRQLLPHVVARLLEAGWAGPEPKVKIQPRAAER